MHLNSPPPAAIYSSFGPHRAIYARVPAIHLFDSSSCRSQHHAAVGAFSRPAVSSLSNSVFFCTPRFPAGTACSRKLPCPEKLPVALAGSAARYHQRRSQPIAASRPASPRCTNYPRLQPSPSHPPCVPPPRVILSGSCGLTIVDLSSCHP